jgi:hypothetical protein
LVLARVQAGLVVRLGWPVREERAGLSCDVCSVR